MYDVEKVKEELNLCKDADAVASLFEDFNTHLSCRPDEEKFPEYKTGDVIDREKPVRWNEEEVTRRMVAREVERARLIKLKREISKLYRNALIEHLAEEYQFSKAETELIYSKAYEEGHSCGIKEVLIYYREFADLYEELKKASKNKEE